MKLYCKIVPCFFILLVFFSCSKSENSDNQITEINILVLDSNSQEPIEGALIEICNSPYFCTNILASGTTNANGKIRLSLTASDMAIAESFTVYKDNYGNSTSLLNQLNLSEEIIINLKMY